MKRNRRIRQNQKKWSSMSTVARLYSAPSLPFGKLSILPHPRGGDWLSDDLKALRLSEKVDVLVSLLTPGEVRELDLLDEPALSLRQGMSFHSFPIEDLHVPPWSAETLAFLETLKSDLEAGHHVAIHCRMGIGRSGTIAASVLVLSGFTPEQACAVLSQARGYQVPETSEQVAWVNSLPQRSRSGENASDDVL